MSKTNKGRNWVAVNMFLRNGNGEHMDKKKEKNKRACRGKVKEE